MKKRLLILTGPQGSGNHMWSKVFSQSPKVQGWKQLTQEYWVGHGLEPFAEVWENPSLFKDLKWPHDFYFTSISCPYVPFNGPLMTDENTKIPKYQEFIETAEEAGFDVTVAVISRDVNILSHQQTRVRQQVTWPIFIENFDNALSKYNPVFVSTESLFLYKSRYISQLERLLGWPIEISDQKLNEILETNTNEKYFKYVESYWLDKHMADVGITHDIQKPKNPNLYRATE
jgi:hypothetical protein